MRGVNKVIIVGHLGNDPETKTFENGGSITNVSVATSEQWTDRQTGERRENTEWHRIVFNNRLAEIAAQYLRKGSAIYVEGKLRTRKWQDQNGQDRWSTEIRADNMQMLGGRNDGNMSQPATNNYQSSQPQQSQPQGNYQAQPAANSYQPNQSQGGYQNPPVQPAAKPTPQPNTPAQVEDDDLPF